MPSSLRAFSSTMSLPVFEVLHLRAQALDLLLHQLALASCCCANLRPAMLMQARATLPSPQPELDCAIRASRANKTRVTMRSNHGGLKTPSRGGHFLGCP